MDYIEVGKLKKPHGLNGELKGTIDERFWEDVAEIDAFFVEIRGEKTPYFIEYLRGKGSLILKFEEVDSKEDARLFNNKGLFLRREDISLTEEEIYDDGLEYAFLKGYELRVESIEEVGKIELVEEYPQQEMAIVSYQEREVLIPLRATWILAVDKENKIVQMSLPEGLLEL